MRHRRPTFINPTVPFAYTKQYSFGEPEVCLAVMNVYDGVYGLEFRLGEQQIVACAVKAEEFVRSGGQYKVLDQPATAVAETLRAKALRHGATLEAIQLFGSLRPLTKEEEASMASNKLQSANTAALKASAKEAPVGGKKPVAPKPETVKGGKAEGTGRKGNVEALAKAREARGPAPNRKYTVVNKKNEQREGTWTHAMVAVILKNKDTDSAKAALVADGGEFADKKLDFKWAEDKGYIKLA